MERGQKCAILAIFAIPLQFKGILFRNRNDIENSKTNSLSMGGKRIFLLNWILGVISPPPCEIHCLFWVPFWKIYGNSLTRTEATLRRSLYNAF